MPAREEHQQRVRIRHEELGEQRIVLRMNLPQRLRAEQQRPVRRQREGLPACIGRNERPLVARADAGERDQRLDVMRLGAFRLHRLGANESVDRRVARRHRMSPTGVLPRRQPKRGQRERTGVHAELGIDEHVERVVAHRRRDDRRSRAAAAERAETVGAICD